MTDRITVYFDGRFAMDDAPAWFEGATEAAWKRPADTTLGSEPGCVITVRSLGSNHGHTACMATDEDNAEDIWLPSRADLLDFLTTRAPAFVGLGEGPSLARSLQTLTAAFVSYARHGQGKHIDLFDGKSERDDAERYPCRS